MPEPLTTPRFLSLGIHGHELQRGFLHCLQKHRLGLAVLEEPVIFTLRRRIARAVERLLLQRGHDLKKSLAKKAVAVLLGLLPTPTIRDEPVGYSGELLQL